MKTSSISSLLAALCAAAIVLPGYVLAQTPPGQPPPSAPQAPPLHYGDVYEKDLGPDTAKLAAAMSEYNPDKTWNETAD